MSGVMRKGTYCTISFNSSVTRHRPSKIDEMSRMSRVPPGDESAWQKMSQIYLKSALPDENCDEIFVLSRGYAATDETKGVPEMESQTRGWLVSLARGWNKKFWTPL